MKDKKSERIDQDKHDVKHFLGEHLFDRPHPPGYIEEWRKFMEQSKLSKPVGQSVMVFRIDDEWLALPTIAIEKITTIQSIHKLPFRTNAVLLGVTNIDGELRMAISLQALLGMTPSTPESDNKKLHLSHNQAILLAKDNSFFVFSVNEISGIAIFSPNNAENVPMTISSSREHYTTNLFKYKNKHVGLLDSNLMIDSIISNYL